MFLLHLPVVACIHSNVLSAFRTENTHTYIDTFKQYESLGSFAMYENAATPTVNHTQTKHWLTEQSTTKKSVPCRFLAAAVNPAYQLTCLQQKTPFDHTCITRSAFPSLMEGLWQWFPESCLCVPLPATSFLPRTSFFSLGVGLPSLPQKRGTLFWLLKISASAGARGETRELFCVRIY